MSGTGWFVGSYKSLYYSISNNWEQLRAVKHPITNTFWLLRNLDVITEELDANMVTIQGEVSRSVTYFLCKPTI